MRRVFVLLALAVACVSGDPQAIAYDGDSCAQCRMQITDPRFGGEIVTRKGRAIKFDAVECLREYYKQAAHANDVAAVWVLDYAHPGKFIAAADARFVVLSPGHTPMGRALIAVSSAADVAALAGGAATVKRWEEL